MCFFLREIIFYSGFILKEEHKQKKKKAYISVCPSFPQLSGNSISALKPKRAPLGAKGWGCFYRAEFLLFCPACSPHPGTP